MTTTSTYINYQTRWHSVERIPQTECRYRQAAGALTLVVEWWSDVAVKAKFHFAIWSQTGPKLVADLQRAGIWPII